MKAHGMTRMAWLVGAIFGCLVATGTSWACDTPVYRYALYRWTPTRYILCRIHDGPEADSSVATVREMVDKAADDPSLPANIVWVDVDARNSEQLQTLPDFVRQRWEQRDAGVQAAYYLVAPHGVILDSHDWTPDEMASLLESPLRSKVGEAIESAKAGVVILLDHPGKTKANQEAARIIERTLGRIRKGELELATAPSVKRPDVAFFRLSKDDEAERWFIRQLLEIESDLASIDEPIVFVVFGRGRALFSCLGRGITEENLARDVEFVSGACSCTVKEQNPGVDLLMRYNWENAATVVAEQYGGETGTDALLDGDQLFPELAIPSDSKDAGSDGASGEEGASSDSDASGIAETSASGEETKETSRAAGDVEPDAESGSVVSTESPTSVGEEPVADKSSSDKALAARNTDVAGEDLDPASPRVGLWSVGLGLAVALVGMLAATFLVLRPRGG